MILGMLFLLKKNPSLKGFGNSGNFKDILYSK